MLKCFTRTFMELKRGNIGKWSISAKVLLVPLWNWNDFTVNRSEVFGSFTRTFMELKRGDEIAIRKVIEFYSYLYGIETFDEWLHKRGLCVLLVPLWNWNESGKLLEQSARLFYSYLYGIETCMLSFLALYTVSFYSYLYGIETWEDNYIRICLFVLLVPLWNWNVQQ